VVRHEHGDVVEEGVDRGKAGVTRPDAVLSFYFEVAQEGSDELSIQLGQGELRGDLAEAILSEAQQEREGALVRADRMRTRLTLILEALGEEALNEGSERGHGSPPRLFSSRCAAIATSSGTAERYQ
jgi:hypothetical protein